MMPYASGRKKWSGKNQKPALSKKIAIFQEELSSLGEPKHSIKPGEINVFLFINFYLREIWVLR